MTDEATTDDSFTPIHDDSTVEELLEQAHGNAQAAIIATVAFLQSQNIPLADWTAGIGARFSRAWGEVEPWDAHEFLDAMLTNLRSLGATVESARLDDPDAAEAVVTGFPDLEQCEQFDVDPADAVHFLDATIPIATDRGLDWSWHRDGETLRIAARRMAR